MTADMSRTLETTDQTREESKPIQGQKIVLDEEKRDELISKCWTSFNDRVFEDYSNFGHILESANRVRRHLLKPALAAAIENHLIPDFDGNSVGEIERALEMPVAVQAEALPVLIKYLRVMLIIARCKEVRAELEPWHWDAMGDEGALNWDDPNTTAHFEVLFRRYVSGRYCQPGEWEKAGLTPMDFLVDGHTLPARPFLTVVQSTVAAGD